MATKTNLIPLAKVRKWPSALTGQQSSTSSTSVSISEEQNGLFLINLNKFNFFF